MTWFQRRALLCAWWLLPPAIANAQRQLPSGYGGLVACGSFWLLLERDAVRFRRSPDGARGKVEVSMTVDSTSSDGLAILVRARSAREDLRVPLRLFIDTDSILTFRDSGSAPRRHSGGGEFVVGGDAASSSSLEVIDGWRMRLWRLSDAAADPRRIAILPAGQWTLTRRVEVRLGARPYRNDSIFVPFQVQALRPGPVFSTSPPAFDAATHLGDVPLVRDSNLSPLPFYDGIVVLRFRAGVGLLERQQVMDRLQGRIIASRLGSGEEPDLIVRVGKAWQDSLKQPYVLRKLGREVKRFGYLVWAEKHPLMVHPDSRSEMTLVDAHLPESCADPADREVRRRLAMVQLVDASPEERQEIASAFGGVWRQGASGVMSRLELVGTRDQVNRQLALMQRLPQVGFALLNELMAVFAPICK